MFREIFLTKIVVLNQKNITWEDVAGKIAILYQENMDMIQNRLLIQFIQ